MTALPHKRYTPEEYLALERESDTKHEYLDGQIYDMAGAKPNHNLIVASASGSLTAQLLDRDCFTYSSDQRVDVRVGGLFAYPDITVVCGEPQYDAEGDSLLNPTLIVEVLSPSTERYDRGEKFLRYRALASCREYVLIAQHKPLIEVYTRQQDDNWLLVTAQGLETSVALESVGCTLALSDIYRRVTFESGD